MSGPGNLVALAARHVQLHRDGRYWKGCCPFHDERTPSFKIFPDQHFHCFGCGAHGDAIDFIRRIEGVSFTEARERAGGVICRCRQSCVSIPRCGRAIHARRTPR